MASHDSTFTRSAESISDYQWPAAYYGNAPEFQGDYFSGFYGNAFLFPPYFLDSQKRGEAVTHYLTAVQLKTIRDRSRRLCSENEFAISALLNRISYIVGSGFNYRILPLHDSVKPEELERVQAVVNIFAEAAQLSVREAECVYRVDRDGEAFIRLFPHESGLLQLRWVEPEHVKSPSGDHEAKDSFGIQTNPRDVEDIRGYWVVEEPLHDTQPTLVPANEIRHIKMNLDSSSKRGLPLTYPVEANLRRAEEILASISSQVKHRAKIAMIRKLTGTGKTAAQNLKTEIETGQTYNPSTGMPMNVEELRPGTILTASGNMDYEWPDVGTSSPAVEVLKAELRAIAARLVMPELMLTADASGGTYSSQLVAEAPATRNFERLQRYYRGVFGECRAPGRESLVWMQIAHAVNVGLLERDILTKIRVVAQAPAIIPRDPDKSAAANKTYFDMRVKSPQQIAGELGIDFEQQEKDFEALGLPTLAEMTTPMPGGMPGDLGTTVPNGMPQPGAGGEEIEGPGTTTDDGGYEFDASMFQ